MSGAYAHLTMVNLMRESKRLETELRFSNPASAALLTNLKFCELGAVSPDYPYLAVGDSGAEKWADLMHWTRVGRMLKEGTPEEIENDPEVQQIYMGHTGHA